MRALSVAVVLGLGGCAAAHAATPDAGPDDGAVSARPCVTHGDCDVGDLCDAASGRCARSSACTRDGDCATGVLWCDFRGTCVTHVAGECRASSDCAGGEVCIEDRCVQLLATCQFTSDCVSGVACVDARCTAVCDADRDCADGDRCEADRHFCTPARECTTSSTCSVGQHCVNGRCLDTCHGSNPCAGGLRETAYCAGDGFCRPSWQLFVICPGEACPAGTQCVRNGCYLPCPTGSSAECGGDVGTECLLDERSGLRLCEVPPSVVPECRTSADCSRDRPVCVNAACAP